MKYFIQKLLAFSSCLLVIAFFPDVANACSCAESGTVDKEFAESPTVVILKLQLVEKVSESENRYAVNGIRQSKLSVEKVFKGELKSGETLTFAQGGGADCIWTFSEDEIGTEFLFYLGKKPLDNGVWLGITCSRSGKLKYRASDVRYLEKEKEVLGKTRLSGMIYQSITSPVEGGNSSYNGLSDRKILITGKDKNIELKTDKNGVYEIYDLPVGKYKITPEKIEGYRISDENKSYVEVEIKAKKHTEKNVEFEINNSISGKLFDTKGKPLKGAKLTLFPTTGKKARYFFQNDYSNDDGTFKFEEIPVGTYIIVVNEDAKLDLIEPFETFYYPNVYNKSEATQITVSAGYFLNNVVINVPKVAETVTISGTLSFKNGKLIPDGLVRFFAENRNSEPNDRYSNEDYSGKTDEQGRFSFNILKGQKGKLVGVMFVLKGEYENCPKLEEILQKKEYSFVTVGTTEVNIETEKDLNKIILKFPFPNCKKAKRN